MKSGETEIIELFVRRLWDVNECAPPCCPRKFIVETAEGRLMHLESWTVLPAPDAFPRHCMVHRAVGTMKLLQYEGTGDLVQPEPHSVRDALLGFDAPECEWLQRSDLPPEFIEAMRQA